MPEADAPGAFQVDGQTSGLRGQFLFDGVARLQVVDPLLGSLMDLVGIFLGQNGHDRQCAVAVLEGISRSRFPIFRFWTSRLLCVTTIRFDSFGGSHGGRLSGEDQQAE